MDATFQNIPYREILALSVELSKTQNILKYVMNL